MKTIIVVADSYEAAIAELTSRMNLENEVANTSNDMVNLGRKPMKAVRSKLRTTNVSVGLYDLNDNLLLVRKKCTDVAKILNISNRTVSAAAINETVMCKRYKVKYINEVITKMPKCISVSSKITGKNLGIFTSVDEVANETGYKPNTINYYLSSGNCPKYNIVRL